MNTDQTAYDYAQRIIREMGLTANDSERALIWAYDNPPRRPLPEVKGERTRQLWISQKVLDCLRSMAETISGENATGGMVDGLANALLIQAMKDHAPELLEFYERFEAERADMTRRLANLRKDEPTLEREEA